MLHSVKNQKTITDTTLVVRTWKFTQVMVVIQSRSGFCVCSRSP